MGPTDVSVDRDIAIFDLDETLTVEDTTLPFVAAYLRQARVPLGALVYAGLAGAAAFLAQRSKKNVVLGMGLAGAPYDDVLGFGGAFALRLIADGLRSEVVEALAAHRARGDLLVLASASLDCYVEPVGRALGFDQIISTRTVRRPDGRLSARLDGRNCKGPEKLAMVLNQFDAATLKGRATAYSDSLSDLPLFGACRQGVFVCRADSTRAAEASRHGLSLLGWT